MNDEKVNDERMNDKTIISLKKLKFISQSQQRIRLKSGHFEEKNAA